MDYCLFGYFCLLLQGYSANRDLAKVVFVDYCLLSIFVSCCVLLRGKRTGAGRLRLEQTYTWWRLLVGPGPLSALGEKDSAVLQGLHHLLRNLVTSGFAWVASRVIE